MADDSRASRSLSSSSLYRVQTLTHENGGRRSRNDRTSRTFQPQSTLFPFLSLSFSLSLFHLAYRFTSLLRGPGEAGGRNKARRCRIELSSLVSLSMQRFKRERGREKGREKAAVFRGPAAIVRFRVALKRLLSP